MRPLNLFARLTGTRHVETGAMAGKHRGFCVTRGGKMEGKTAATATATPRAGIDADDPQMKD